MLRRAVAATAKISFHRSWLRPFVSSQQFRSFSAEQEPPQQRKVAKQRKKFNFGPAIDITEDAKKAMSILLSMKKDAVGIRASYEPAGIQMQFKFDFMTDAEKQHRFDEILPISGGGFFFSKVVDTFALNSNTDLWCYD